MLDTMKQVQQSAVTLKVTAASNGQAFVVASTLYGGDAFHDALHAYKQIARLLRAQGMAIIHERIFGSLSAEAEVMAARGEALDDEQILIHGPVTYFQGNPVWGEGFTGAIIHVVSPGETDSVWTIMDGDLPCGRGWKHNGCTFLVLQNINGNYDRARDNGAKSHQTRRMLERAERILREQGCSYRDVVRTWFYLSDILDWYAAFNKVRNEKYGEFGIMPGPGDRDLLLPASTGISGDSSSGAAAFMDLIAVTGESDYQPAVKRLTSTAQLDAFRYGSAFSRVAVIETPDVSLIEISGTAAIDERGKSQFVDDIRGQIECTLGKIERLLSTEDAELKDIAAATVFVKRPEYAGIFWEMARERGLEDFPAVCIVADVCRDELLFEIDAEAAVNKKGSKIKGFEGPRE